MEENTSSYTRNLKETNRETCDTAMPPMYKMDNYEQCQQIDGQYCFFTFKITPLDAGSQLWKTIKQYEHDIMKLDRSVLDRMICVPNSVNPDYYGQQLLVEHELKGANITIDIFDVYCKAEHSLLIETFMWSVISIIFIFNVISTLIHYKHINDPNWRQTTCQKWFKAFSIKNNFRKLYTENKSSDFQQLKCIQGLRVLTNITVILFHSIISLFQIYVDDIEELEQAFANPIIFFGMFLGSLAVQVFFLISAFLLANQICDVFKRHGQFTLKHCVILTVNRMIRVLPTLLIFTPGLLFIIGAKSPQLLRLSTISCKACIENWWYTLLQINFLKSFREICTPTLWYLSVDTLFYVTTIVLLYCALKFKWDVWNIIGVIGGIVINRYTVYIYINAYNPQFQPYPQVLKDVVSLEVVNQNYINPYGNWPSSLIGLLLGHTYNQYKEQKLSVNNKLKILWWLTFICLPLLVLVASSYSFKGIPAVIIGTILRPAFALSIGIGILGMSLGLGGKIKTFLESKPLLVLSNVTYSTYLLHAYLVFSKAVFLEDLMSFRSQDVVFWIIFDIGCSFAIGTVFAICVEYPGVTLQKMYLPQIKTNDDDNKASKNRN